MKTVPLKAGLRQQKGKQAVKKIRAQKRIPAVVYGSGIKATSIEVSADEFARVIHTRAGENVVIQLTVSGPKNLEKTVVIKEIQHDPVTDGIEHVDFNAISLTEKSKVKVPLHVKGEAPGVKEGGVLDVVHHEIEVECLPTDIPEGFHADISALQIGDSIHIREIKFPAGVEPQFPPDEVVVAVHAPKAEEVPAVEEAQAEPELIAKEKKEEGEEAAPAAAAPAAPTPPAGEAKKSAPEAKK